MDQTFNEIIHPPANEQYVCVCVSVCAPNIDSTDVASSCLQSHIILTREKEKQFIAVSYFIDFTHLFILIVHAVSSFTHSGYLSDTKTD